VLLCDADNQLTISLTSQAPTRIAWFSC